MMGPYGVRFLTVFVTHALLSNTATRASSPVEVTMNHLLAFPGWIKLDVCEIKERRTDGEERVDMRQLLTPGSSPDGPVVTAENVDRKIRQTHQFLTCNFADHLSRYYDYVRGIGLQCERMESPEESLHCLELYVQMIKQSAVPMLGALTCLRQLMQPQTEHDPAEMSRILEDIRTYYDGKTLDLSALKDGTEISLSAVVKAEVGAIDGEILKFQKQLAAFFTSFCWRDSFWDEESVGVSYGSFRVKTLTSQFGPGRALYEIEKSARRERDRFMRFFDGSFGFEYNPKTMAVRLTPI